MKKWLWRVFCLALLCEVAFIDKPIGRLGPVFIMAPDNGCEVAAREMEAAVMAEQGLRHYKVWAHIVAVQYGWWKRMGHAYCIYTLQNGEVVAYDINRGTVELGTKDTDIKTVLKSLKWFYPEIRSGRYLD